MGLDTIIVGRGGGSDEELNSYNHERIARAVAEAKTPIVSAVGHQGHWTLIDFVADKRVATPSEAAEETIPDVMTDISRIELLKNTIRDRMKAIIENRRLLIKSTLSNIEKNSPQNRLNENKDRLKHFSELMDMNIRSAFQKYNNRFEVLLAELNGLSPTAKLVGGFGYVTKENKPVKNVADVKPGDDINIRMHDGDITATVK